MTIIPAHEALFNRWLALDPQEGRSAIARMFGQMDGLAIGGRDVSQTLTILELAISATEKDKPKKQNP